MERLDLEKLPHHIAIIMDGNGRWAQRQNLSRIHGHQKGLEAVREVVEACGDLGIKVLTLYAFSKENWQRPRDEVTALMKLLEDYLLKERKELIQKNIRLTAIGDLTDLPQQTQKVLFKTIDMTRQGNGLILNLALSYGGRSEIISGIKNIVREISERNVSIEDINLETFCLYLSTKDLPDPDLLIRTSGEKRVSNFLLWQIAYTELYFTETLWPDFGKDELVKALIDYCTRERRFGLTSSQLQDTSTL